MSLPSILILAAAIGISMPAELAAWHGAQASLAPGPNSSPGSSAPAQDPNTAPAGAKSPSGPAKSGELQPQSRLTITRDVGGEFAKTLQPLPRGKDGFKFLVGKPIDPNAVMASARIEGIAVNKGETVEITSIEFRAKEIVVLINGGAKKKFHLREHLQIGVGNTPVAPAGAHPGEGLGSVLTLDYGRPLPDMSAADLKHDLSGLLDFSGQASATVNYVDTLAPEFKQGIQEHHAVVGMDQEMVISAIGRPERKVRERSPEGDDTEDWIYGDPPGKTMFVTFSAGKVIRVKEFN